MSFIETPKHDYYNATVVELKNFVDLPNCNNVKAALIFSNSVIVSKEAKEGDIGLFFPAGTALSREFVGENNLYRKHEYGNKKTGEKDPKGFFEQSGRVKAVKFRGHKSEGFFLGLSSLDYLNLSPSEVSQLRVGVSFDKLGDNPIARKYVPKGEKTKTLQAKGKQPKLEDSIVENQFRLHYDTSNLRRNAFKINPHDWISITDKWHGTSVVIGKPLVKVPVRWWEKIFIKLGLVLQAEEPGLVYSSRRVIKAVAGVTKASNHFYSEDIWGIVAKEVESRIPNNYTIYGEIVGYTPDSSPIQGGYSYGCKSDQHKLVIYRVTLTNVDGVVLELSWPQVQEFALKYGFETVPTFYYGRARDLFNLETEGHWHENFLHELEQTYVRDNDCPFNEKGTPAEGIVVRVDRLTESEAFKLKNFRFLEHESDELDKGIIDTETAQSEQEEEEYASE